LVSIVAWAAAVFLASSHATAQDWPTRLVRIVVPAAAGGSSDAAARLVTNHFQAVFRQPFVIENKPGNGNAMGAAFVAQAEPDGYTLLVSNSASNLTVPLVARNAGYDPVADFSHIVMLTSSPYVLAVYPKLGVKSLADFVATARAQSFPTRLPIAAGSATSAANISSAWPASPCSMCRIGAAVRRWPMSLRATYRRYFCR